MSLAPFWYYSMFERCYNLEEAPELPAKVLSRYCYAAMFIDCNSLYKAPELPASTLDTNCYNAMFRDSYSVYLVYMSGITEAEYDASLYGDISEDGRITVIYKDSEN